MKISVIIPAYNAENTIEECINSVINQSYKDIEIIVIDDGSLDNTSKIINKIAEKNKNLKIIKQKNQGASVARNTGIQNASGEFIMFIDADDAILPKMIETLVDYQKKYKVDLVKSGICKILDSNKKIFDTCKKNLLYYSKDEIYRNFFEIFSNGLNSPVGKLYKLSIIKENAVYFSKELELSEDLHFNLHYLEVINSALFITEVFYQYYLYNSTVTKKYRKNLFANREKAIVMLDDYLMRNSLDRNIIDYLYIKLVFAAAIQEIEHKVPRKERLKQISFNLNRKEVDNAIINCQPRGKLEKILYGIIKYKNISLIDIFARMISIVKKCNFLHISRISV